MSDGIYAKVRKYATSEGTPENHYEDDGYDDWLFKPNNHYEIYEQMMELTNNNHEISTEAASWCKLATIGEIYEFREGEIEIVYID